MCFAHSPTLYIVPREQITASLEKNSFFCYNIDAVEEGLGFLNAFVSRPHPDGNRPKGGRCGADRASAGLRCFSLAGYRDIYNFQNNRRNLRRQLPCACPDAKELSGLQGAFQASHKKTAHPGICPKSRTTSRKQHHTGGYRKIRQHKPAVFPRKLPVF